MLLACGPLLAPSGLCVCKAGRPGGAVAVRASVEVPPTAPKMKRSGCTCCDSAPVAKSRSTLPPKPSPTDDHLPGCPASPGADSLKWVEASPQVVVVQALLEIVALVAEPAPVVPRVSLTSARWSSSPPLYLSHCALVI
jgi:hypothetical protein